jgi:hypothetical protein
MEVLLEQVQIVTIVLGPFVAKVKAELQGGTQARDGVSGHDAACAQFIGGVAAPRSAGVVELLPPFPASSKTRG